MPRREGSRKEPVKKIKPFTFKRLFSRFERVIENLNIDTDSHHFRQIVIVRACGLAQNLGKSKITQIYEELTNLYGSKEDQIIINAFTSSFPQESDIFEIQSAIIAYKLLKNFQIKINEKLNVLPGEYLLTKAEMYERIGVKPGIIYSPIIGLSSPLENGGFGILVERKSRNHERQLHMKYLLHENCEIVVFPAKKTNNALLRLIQIPHNYTEHPQS